MEVVALKVTDKKPMPEAARTEPWELSWPEDKDEPGTPPSMAVIGQLMVKLAAGISGRFAACNCWLLVLAWQHLLQRPKRREKANLKSEIVMLLVVQMSLY